MQGVDAFQRKTLELLAANVRRIRLSAGLTQAQLAEAIEVEPRFVQSVEAGSTAPSFKTQCSIAKALDVEVRELFAPATKATRNPGRPRKRSSQ